MIEEAKTTLRSTEPYIGGETETGERIHRYRNKSRELAFSRSRVDHAKSVQQDRLLTSNMHKRQTLNHSIDSSSIFNESTYKILEKSRLDTAENQPTMELTVANPKQRPVSAYTHKMNMHSETVPTQDMRTRPSTSGKESIKPTLNFTIRRSLSFKKDKSSKNETSSKKSGPHEQLNLTLSKAPRPESGDQTRKSPIQLYYKSIEPYFKKKPHISGYEAEAILKPAKSESNQASSSTSQNSVIINDTVIIDTEDKSMSKTGQNWNKGESNSYFSKISEEETVSDRNSYGLNLVPRRTKKGKVKRKAKNRDIVSIVSSYF